MNLFAGKTNRHWCGYSQAPTLLSDSRPILTILYPATVAADSTRRLVGMTQQWRTIVVIYAIAAFFNYVWELAQSSLYVGTGNLRNIWWHCGFAAIVDGFLVLVIYIAGCLVFSDPYWFEKPG